MVSNKPARSSCLFTLSHHNSTLIMVFYLKSIKVLLIYASSKYLTDVNQRQLFVFFFGKQAENYVIVDCLTGYVSLLLCKLILVVTVVIGLQIVTENSNKS